MISRCYEYCSVNANSLPSLLVLFISAVLSHNSPAAAENQCNFYAVFIFSARVRDNPAARKVSNSTPERESNRKPPTNAIMLYNYVLRNSEPSKGSRANNAFIYFIYV
jgi:hypothetical protein